MQLYVDMDGVLADFDQHHEDVFGERACKIKENVDWAKIRAIPDYYANLPPMPDMWDLWDHIESYDPIVLTGVPYSVSEAEENKRGWIKRHLGGQVPVIGCKSKDKCLHGKPGDILIDDWTKYQHLWEGMGGRWITHVSAADTIARLKDWGLY